MIEILNKLLAVNTVSEEMETSLAYRARLQGMFKISILNGSHIVLRCMHDTNRVSRCQFALWATKEARTHLIFINLLHVLPEMEGPKPPVFVSGWSRRPGWRSQYNKPHEGQMNTATACQQGWFHCRTDGRSLRLAHPSSTCRCRPSACYGTIRVDTK